MSVGHNSLVQSHVKSLSTLRYFLYIYFILNHLASKISSKVIAYPIFTSVSKIDKFNVFI